MLLLPRYYTKKMFPGKNCLVSKQKWKLEYYTIEKSKQHKVSLEKSLKDNTAL